MVKLLSGKTLHIMQDNILQSPLVEARKDEISSISAKGDHQINTPITYFSCLYACSYV